MSLSNDQKIEWCGMDAREFQSLLASPDCKAYRCYAGASITAVRFASGLLAARVRSVQREWADRCEIDFLFIEAVSPTIPKHCAIDKEWSGAIDQIQVILDRNEFDPPCNAPKSEVGLLMSSNKFDAKWLLMASSFPSTLEWVRGEEDIGISFGQRDIEFAGPMAAR